MSAARLLERGDGLSALGRQTQLFLTGLGAAVALLGRSTKAVLKSPRRQLFRAVAGFGFEALGVSVGTAAIVGVIVVTQAGIYAEQFGARQYLGWAAGYAITWEFGPLVLGLMMAARIGARNATELAVMKARGLFEGLSGVAIDPVVHLVAPRLFGTWIATTLLAPATFLVAFGFEALAALYTMRLPLRVFFVALSDMLSAADLFAGFIKCTAFGAAIAIISTAKGVGAEPGARGVGRAAAAAVVSSAAAIFLLDFVLTAWLVEGLAR